ncbi:PQQ-binding-like beta-propeller repeat protein [Cohnella suwonensis]|uniref:PQQ-binding-like beta-propeller repeat protein n=1 Tax=Cohnella suwonensis TaxID=696072 RepID=A0ABW0M002_9BACL
MALKAYQLTSIIILLALLAVIVACTAETIEKEAPRIAMFRGDAAHSGVYETEGVPELTGEKWRLNLGSPSNGSPTIAGKSLFIGADNGILRAIDPEEGKVKWTYKAKGKIRSTPAVYEDEVYFTDDLGNAYALNEASGTVRWTAKLDGPIGGKPVASDTWDYYLSSPVVDASAIYVGSAGRSFVALDRKSGQLLWKRESETGTFHSTAALTEKAVYIGDDLGTLYALNIRNGNILWTAKTIAPFQSSPSVRDGVVYIGGRDTFVHAYEADTGEPLWRHSSGTSWVPSSPATTDSLVVVGSSDAGLVHVLDRMTGKRKLNFILPERSRVFSSPAIAGNVMYFGTAFTDGKFEKDALYAVDLDTGKLAWRFDGTKAPIVASPIVWNGVVYYASQDGYLFALQ